MTTHMNVQVQARPALAPLWTGGYQNLGGLPTTAYRTVQAPLLSPSPMSPKTLPSPMYPISQDGSMQRKDRALVDILNNNMRPSTLASPKSVTPGQSPLVSKLEHVSLQFAEPAKPMSLEAPLPASHHGNSSATYLQARRKSQPRGDYGNMRTADAFVIARSLRRESHPDFIKAYRSSVGQKDPSSSRGHKRLTLRAIIRPRSPERQPFLIQRTLDIEELRATTSPTTPERPGRHVSLSKAVRRPLPVPTKWTSSGSRRPSAGLTLSSHEPSSNGASHSLDYEKLIRDQKTVPIHRLHTIATLPALDVLLASGHVRQGDIIYLPVPHAESWPQTVRYVYTGQGELTPAMRENILYLGGRVEF